jgi:GntR family transcriptional regulator/MocR family aminotransferase
MSATQDIPLYKQIYGRVVASIGDGTLESGMRVPSVRALAQELGVARGTVEAAYHLLVADGYLRSHGRAGTRVAEGAANMAVHARALAPHAGEAGQANTIPAKKTPAKNKNALPPLSPFQMGVPALDAFPRKVWARLAAGCARAAGIADLQYPDPFGLAALRQAIAAYVHVSRGVACGVDQVCITAGYRDSLRLIAQALLLPRHVDTADLATGHNGHNTTTDVWIENPCYPPTQHILRGLGIRPVAVDVDADGLIVAQGRQKAAAAAMAVVTPAHQSPLCVALSPDRRQQILDWAVAQQSWIVEDDYDGEFRYASKPLPALKSQDDADRVIYAGTFSKVLFPALRLSYLVVPRACVPRFQRALRVFGWNVPLHTQQVTQAFMAEGFFTRHIHKMRRLYQQRRTDAVAGLAAALGVGTDAFMPAAGGMHLILQMQAAQHDQAAVARILQQGMFAEALSQWYSAVPAKEAPHQGVLLGFTNINSEAQAYALGQRLKPLL